MSKTIQEIEQQYANLAAELGDAYFKLNVTFPKKIEDLKQKINDLNTEAKAASQKAHK